MTTVWNRNWFRIAAVFAVILSVAGCANLDDARTKTPPAPSSNNAKG